MLDRSKLIKELDQAVDLIIFEYQNQQAQARAMYDRIGQDPTFCDLIQSKKWANNLVHWSGLLGQSIAIELIDHPYRVLAVDGSQIYYDRHQGPACFLINIGIVFFNYTKTQSAIECQTKPYLFFDQQEVFSQDLVNQKRDLLENQQVLHMIKTEKILDQKIPFLILHDGLLINMAPSMIQDASVNLLKDYFELFEQYAECKILHAGYVSLPSSTFLVQLLEIAALQYAEQMTFNKLSDIDVAQFFLKPNTRSVVFEVKSSLSYIYPKHLKPYVCFLHVESEIVRIEIPAWIAKDDFLIDRVCALILDQVKKGSGYPISLIHAHQQAVVKTHDRTFFYETLNNMVHQKSKHYVVSQKSIKKMIVDF